MVTNFEFIHFDRAAFHSYPLFASFNVFYILRHTKARLLILWRLADIINQADRGGILYATDINGGWVYAVYYVWDEILGAATHNMIWFCMYRCGNVFVRLCGKNGRKLCVCEWTMTMWNFIREIYAVRCNNRTSPRLMMRESVGVYSFWANLVL